MPPSALLATVEFVPGDRDAGAKPPGLADDEPRACTNSDPLDRPNLEPITAAAHPPQNRRMPTQPPISLVFEHEPMDPRPDARPGPQLSPRHSPTPVRRGLFSSTRSINIAAGLAVGLVLAIFPAMKLAQRSDASKPETAREQPATGDEVIATANDEHRKHGGARFTLAWLLIGLPLGLGLGFAPRPGD